MPRSKKAILKKGYIMVYTLIVSFIILSIFSYMYTIEMKRKICILDNSRNMNEKLYNEETNEYLFSKMNDFILNNIKDVNKNSVHNFFVTNKNVKFGNEQYYISYSTGLDEFLLYEPCKNNKYNKINEYDYTFQNGKINYIYKVTKYE